MTLEEERVGNGAVMISGTLDEYLSYLREESDKLSDLVLMEQRVLGPGCYFLRLSGIDAIVPGFNQETGMLVPQLGEVLGEEEVMSDLESFLGTQAPDFSEDEMRRFYRESYSMGFRHVKMHTLAPMSMEQVTTAFGIAHICSLWALDAEVYRGIYHADEEGALPHFHGNALMHVLSNHRPVDINGVGVPLERVLIRHIVGPESAQLATVDTVAMHTVGATPDTLRTAPPSRTWKL